jgi:hypothetical protein
MINISCFYRVIVVLVLLGVIVVLVLFDNSYAQSLEWKSTPIGAAKGEYTWKGATLVISGSSAGLNIKDADEVYFVSFTKENADFEVVARMVAFDAPKGAYAGIMVRADHSPQASSAATWYTNDKPGVGWMYRLSIQPANSWPRVNFGGIELQQPAPIWLKFVRVGRSFAAFRSRDGKLWAPMSNASGGGFDINGPMQVGFFVSSGNPHVRVTATFDSIEITRPRMSYQTTWVGNSCGYRWFDGHVSNGASAMWVAPDGTVYTSSYWDEAGRPVTSYKNGKVARALPVGTPQTADGGITGDERYIYVAWVDRILRLDPSKPDFAPQPLTLSINLMDKTTNTSVVAGMASNGKKLYVSDARDNVVRVVNVEPVQTLHQAVAANDGITLAPGPVELPRGEARLAPAVVYQTQRTGEGIRYLLPGFEADKSYTIRVHTVDYLQGAEKNEQRQIQIRGKSFHVAKLAGGPMKALVLDFTDWKADKNGRIDFTWTAPRSAPGVCAIEVLDGSGKRLLGINCGGPAVEGFLGETQEDVHRAFAVERPGAMVFDKRGDLWIVQRWCDHPGTPMPKHPAAIKCYSPDGKFTGRAITDVSNPRALAYDAAKDELIVGENAPDFNVRFYGALDSQPKLVRTFGEKGGIYAGTNPGLIHDPTRGGYARFAGITGVGKDASGHLYVAGGFQGTDLRAFKPDGTLDWMLYSNVFVSTYDVDPASDGEDVYAAYNHIKLDFNKPLGQHQTYVSYNYDIRRFGEPKRASSSQAILRRLGPQKQLVMYTSGQGTISDVLIFRYQGELAIPCGSITTDGNFWVDSNGNGKVDAGEVTKHEGRITWATALVVDSKGDLWLAHPGTGGSFMRRYFFKGLNEHGVPIYKCEPGVGYEDIPFPEEGAKTSAWGMSVRFDYDADRDVLIAMYPAVPRKGESDTSAPQYFFARYDNWLKGNRTPTWKVKAFDPITHPQYFLVEVNPYPYRGYMGLQYVGDYVFLAYIFGEVHVFDANTGQLVDILFPGPEVGGHSAWEDAAMGLRAFKRKNGEYLVFTENSGWGGKNNVFRWRPPKAKK